MKIQTQVILIVTIFFVEFYCEEAILENEGLASHKESENIEETVERQNEHNSPLLSEINNSELPENPFSVKQKRCPKYRLGSPLVGSSPNSDSSDDNKNKLYSALCKTCLVRNKCNDISECTLCKHWCNPSKVCTETDADGDTKGKLAPGAEQTNDETVAIGNRGSFDDKEEEAKSNNVQTVELKPGNLMEIILSLLGVYDSKDVESVTIAVKSKGDKPIVLNNLEENSVRGQKLAEKLKDLCSMSDKLRFDDNGDLSHEKLHKLISELISKLRSHGDDSSVVGSPNDVIPEVESRLTEPEPSNIIHQSPMNPDVIEDSPDMSQVRDQRVRMNSDLSGNPAEQQVQNKIDDQFPTVHKNVERPIETRLASDNLERQQNIGQTSSNYEPLNEDIFNSNDQTLSKVSDNNFDEEQVQKDTMGAKPLLEKMKNLNFEPKPQELMNRLRSQQKPNFANEENSDNGARFVHHHHPVHHHQVHHPVHGHHQSHHHSKFPHHHRSNDDAEFGFVGQPFSQQYDNTVGQPISNRDSQINTQFAPQRHDGIVGQPFHSMFAPQQYDGLVGQPIRNGDNLFNARFPSQPFDNFVHPQNQLNSRLASFGQPVNQFDNLVGRPFYPDNQLNSRFAPQQYENTVGQPISNSRFDTPAEQRFTDARKAYIPLDRPQFLSQHSDFSKIHHDVPLNRHDASSTRQNDPDHPSKSDRTLLASRNDLPSGAAMEKNSFFFPKKEDAFKPTVSRSSDPELSAELLEMNKEDEDSPVGAAHASDTSKFVIPADNSPKSPVETDSERKRNILGARTSELIKRLKDKQDQTAQRLENHKQQLEKARANVFGGSNAIDEENAVNRDSSKLGKSSYSIPDTAKSVPDETKDPINSQTNNLPHILSRTNDDIVGSQPLESSFERMSSDNAPIHRPWHNQRQKSLPEEDPFEAVNDERLGMAAPDLSNRGQFEDTQSHSNALGKIVPAGNEVDISFKNPSDIYFIGQGIKLPLQMVPQSDGAVHFSVDMEKLCSCNKTSCPKNHTAKELEETVEAILEKEAELKNQLVDLGDVPLGMAAPNDVTEQDRSQRHAERNFVDLKNRIATKFESERIQKRSIDDPAKINLKERFIQESNNEKNENADHSDEKQVKLSKIFKTAVGKGLKDIKKTILNVQRNTQTISNRQPKQNIFESKTLEDTNENIIPLSKTYKFKGLEDELAKKLDNIDKSVDNYSKIDDKIFQDESTVLNEFNEDPLIQKEIGLVTDVLGFFKKLAVESTKHKNI